MKHIVCFSGGIRSAIAAMEVVRSYGKNDVVLLNHDMHFSVEHPDIKRFKSEVAAYLGLEITFANRRNASQDQFDVCVEAGAFKVKNGQELCTSRLKTEPFMNWLAENAPDKNAVIYYGFDADETVRIQRRIGIMGAQGWRIDIPALWPDRAYTSTEDVGVPIPTTYTVFKHGNCVGCLKAGWQHWYIVYCTRPDIWIKAKWAEDEIGHAIHHDSSGPVYLESMEEKFETMKKAGIPPTEQIPYQKFWGYANKVVELEFQGTLLPCECSL